MENLKRKLSSTRRPETASRNLLPELNQYKQNNVALQKQIESLMAKLNESKQSERSVKASLDEMTKSRNEWQERAEEVGKTVKSAQSLQNTIDHLESRLEIANIEKLDAQEQLFNLQAQKSPFDARLPSLEIPPVNDHDQDICAAQMSHMSTSTIFSSSSPISPEKESQDLSTLATFVAHIERLQDQVRQKDAEILDLERHKEELQHKHDQIAQEQHALTLQVDIQNELLRKTRRTDAQIEQLRAAVMDREAMIGEKDKSVRAVERQLEYHKLLLQAQIRRHATMTLHAATNDEPLPEPSKVKTRADIDKWIEKLNERLQKEKPTAREQRLLDPDEARLADLRQEVDFYVREIIYYKLDIRGYKSDIKKLKKITAQLSSYASIASDLDSETSSLRPAATPVATPELGSSSSPAISKLTYGAHPLHRPITPPPSEPRTASKSAHVVDSMKTMSEQVPLHLESQAPVTPQTPTRKMNITITERAEHADIGHRMGRKNSTVCEPMVLSTIITI
jgi:chromosome segregation ATPase